MEGSLFQALAPLFLLFYLHVHRPAFSLDPFFFRLVSGSCSLRKRESVWLYIYIYIYMITFCDSS
jgi:hypothetical protein